MKTILDYMNQIAAMIDNKKPTQKGPFHVYIIDRRLQVGRVAETCRKDLTILYITTRDINEGLKDWQWNIMHEKLVTLIREGKIK